MKRRWLVIMSLLLGLGMPCWTNGVMAASIDDVDAKAIQTVVQSQLNAFAEDDAARAFALATAETRSLIGSADDFLRMIKEEYEPIYRHRRAIYSDPEVIDGNTIQMVRVTDRDNHVWVAIFKMQREADGNWKIDGCQLLQTTSVSV
jgi:hypothetical protein